MNIQPHGQYILCKKYTQPAKKKGILLLQDEKKFPHWGHVVDYGNDCDPWDEVLVQFKPYTAIPIDGSDEYFCIKEDDIICYIDLDGEIAE